MASDGDAYYRKRGLAPYPVHGQPMDDWVISDKASSMLSEMKAIFDRRGTDYRVIISPLYDRRKLNEADANAMRRIFGAELVFDYSGVNEFTTDFHNYYEESHYRPQVAREILKRIYEGK